jgi:hypothetical protein
MIMPSLRAAVLVGDMRRARRTSQPMANAQNASSKKDRGKGVDIPGLAVRA